MQEHAKALGQKYMGIRPETHVEQVFKAPYIADGASHPVPITNFLNAQCKLRRCAFRLPRCAAADIQIRLLRDLPRHAPTELQGHSRHWKLQPLGPWLRVQLDRLLSPHKVRRLGLVHIQEERLFVRDPLRIRRAQRLCVERCFPDRRLEGQGPGLC
jgi:hypothetical protein